MYSDKMSDKEAMYSSIDRASWYNFYELFLKAANL